MFSQSWNPLKHVELLQAVSAGKMFAFNVLSVNFKTVKAAHEKKLALSLPRVVHELRSLPSAMKVLTIHLWVKRRRTTLNASRKFNCQLLFSRHQTYSRSVSKPGSEFVRIHIGEESQVFSIHLDVISHDSSYFRDAFSRQHGIEGQTKIMILKDIEVKVFGMFNQWLYTKVIECDGTEPDLMDLAKLWSCASVWRVSQLQNDAMKLLIPLVSAQVKGPAAGRNNILQQFIDHAYSTKEYSVLKKLVVHKMMSFIPTVRNVARGVSTRYADRLYL